MEIELILMNQKNNTIHYKTAVYNQETMMDEIILDNFDEEEYIFVYDESDCRLQTVVDYYFHNQRIIWNANPKSILVNDYLERFPKCKKNGIKLIIPSAGIGDGFFDGIEELIIDIQSFVNSNPIISGLITSMFYDTFKGLANWLREKRKDRISAESLRKAIQSKKEWGLREAYKAFDIHSFEKLTLLMDFMGYQYDETQKKYCKSDN